MAKQVLAPEELGQHGTPTSEASRSGVEFDPGGSPQSSRLGSEAFPASLHAEVGVEDEAPVPRAEWDEEVFTQGAHFLDPRA